jgi:hypothetical protein
MDVARRAHHGIDLARLGVEPLDRLWIGDVDLEVAALPADADDLVPWGECPIDGFAERTRGSDENDLHDALRFDDEKTPSLKPISDVQISCRAE